MNYQIIRDEVREIEEAYRLQHDDEKAASMEHKLLYDFIDFIAQADYDFLSNWALELLKVKDMDFRR